MAKASKTTATSKAVTKTKVLSSRQLRSQESVENAIAILNTAIDNGLSLSEASRQHNFGRNYLSDVKARIHENYEKKLIKRDAYNAFKRLLKAYEKL